MDSPSIFPEMMSAHILCLSYRDQASVFGTSCFNAIGFILCVCGLVLITPSCGLPLNIPFLNSFFFIGSIFWLTTFLCSCIAKRISSSLSQVVIYLTKPGVVLPKCLNLPNTLNTEKLITAERYERTNLPNQAVDPDSAHLCIRLMHPSFQTSLQSAITTEPKFKKTQISTETLFLNGDEAIVSWLKSYPLQGLKAKIIYALMMRLLQTGDNDPNYFSKMILSLTIHREQIALFCAWCIALLIISFTGKTLEFDSTVKIILRLQGVCWLVLALHQYRSQARALEQLLSEFHFFSRSAELPLYFWEPQLQQWQLFEIPSDFKPDIIEQYGLGFDKAFTLMNATLLAFYSALIGWL